MNLVYQALGREINVYFSPRQFGYFIKGHFCPKNIHYWRNWVDADIISQDIIHLCTTQKFTKYSLSFLLLLRIFYKTNRKYSKFILKKYSIIRINFQRWFSAKNLSNIFSKFFFFFKKNILAKIVFKNGLKKQPTINKFHKSRLGSVTSVTQLHCKCVIEPKG